MFNSQIWFFSVFNWSYKIHFFTGNRVACTRGWARGHSAPRFETTTQVNPILFDQSSNKIVGTNQVDSRIFNVHSPGLQAIRETPLSHQVSILTLFFVCLLWLSINHFIHKQGMEFYKKRVSNLFYYKVVTYCVAKYSVLLCNFIFD